MSHLSMDDDDFAAGDPVWLDVEILRISDEAILFSDGDTEAWIPKSLLIDLSLDRDELEESVELRIQIPEWKARQAGLI